MNTPPMRSEQLSPQLSPIAFSLDDNRNTVNSGANSLQHLLASPTKFKLDSGNNESSNINGTNNIYRTSLSKLSELSRTGRSRQRSNSDTLRSVSPIRFQLFNSAPKMLKPEYISQQPSASPLLSTLMKHTTTQSASNSGATCQSDASSNRNGIRETLEQIQREQRELLQRQEQKKAGQSNKEEQKHSRPQQPQQPVVPQKSEIRQENKIQLVTKEREPSQRDSQQSGTVTKEKTIETKEPVLKKDSSAQLVEDARDLPNSSSAMTVDLKYIAEEMNFEMLDADRNGFASFGDSKSNRYSFISSSSTDYDGADWCNNQPDVRTSQSEETAKLDHRIKQLEVEIDHLKLQNEKLIQSITTTRTAEDRFVLETFRDTRSSKRQAQKGMEMKVKQLEKRVESYRKAIKSCEDSSAEPTTTNDGCIPDYKSISSKKRITRISSGDLRKIDEQGDSSGSSSEEERDEQITKHENYTDRTLTRELFQQQCSDQLSMRRKQGLHLNIQLQMQRNKK